MLLTYCGWICLGCGAWNLFSGLVVHTTDLHSAVFFRVMPSFSGIALLGCGAKLLGWV